MNIVLRVIIDLFIVGGCFFAFAGAVGIVRMPDTFSSCTAGAALRRSSSSAY